MKASVYIATSLDGYIARENGALDWLPGSSGDGREGGSDYGYQAFFDSIDVLVMGRNTFEMVLSFGQWPYGRKRVVVLSRSLTRLTGLVPETVELRSGSPAELWAELQASGARHLYVDGGKTIQGFLDAGLIDEITITRIPVLIGRGIPLFGDLAKDIPLQHLRTEVFESGLVQSRYAVDR
jgi:dihydrofolate reductase